MSKTRGYDARIGRDYGRRRCLRSRGFAPAPLPLRADVKAERKQRHQAEGVNWRVKLLDNGRVMAYEPGGEHEQVFEGPADPFGEALDFAARCLRGETDPTQPDVRLGTPARS